MSEKGWRDIPIGGIISTPGSSVNYKTGGWRAYRPIRDDAKCTDCMICWIFCPDSAVQVSKSQVVDIDLEHCKGCGICAKECPIKCIEMVEEAQAQAQSEARAEGVAS